MTNISFAGNNEDTTTNLYDAQFREYGIQGRWPSPDPAGAASANLANPQSWNRYAYVLNDPLLFNDPTGLILCALTNSDGSTGYVDVSGPACEALGGSAVKVGQSVTVNGGDGGGSVVMTVISPVGGALGNNGPNSAGNFGPQTPGQVARCAANLANTMSVAHYAHLQNVPVASNIFSNDFSSLTNLFFGPGRPGAAVGLAENLGSGPALSLTGKGAGAMTVDSGFQFLFSSAPATTFGETAIGGVLTKSLSVAADWLSGEAEAQAIYDAGIYTGAVYVCAAQ